MFIETKKEYEKLIQEKNLSCSDLEKFRNTSNLQSLEIKHLKNNIKKDEEEIAVS